VKVIDAAKGAIKNLQHHQFGKCNVCGNLTVFVCIDPQTARNNMYCPFCRSSSRKRHVAKLVIKEVIPNISSISDIPQTQPLKIYNADTDDALYKVLQNYEGYHCSRFSPEIEPGTEMQKRVFCQNLEHLTFGDEVFDLAITEDVFEHVRHHEKGFREIHRILKLGGYHVFTIPCNFDRPTTVRVDTSGEKDIHLLPPEYHGDKIRGQILAYRTFGIDLFELLKTIGFETKVDFSSYLDQQQGIFDSYVFCSQKVG
jgi:SAM-dependent methyltransferase